VSGKAKNRRNTGSIARFFNAVGADFRRPTTYMLSKTAIKLKADKISVNYSS
jgi:hypothetical protein